MRRLLIVILLFMWSFCANAQEFRIYFSHGESNIEPLLANNKNTLNAAFNAINKASKENRIISIEISSYTSPDGTSSFNENLAKERLESFSNWLNSNLDHSINRSLIKKDAIGIAWEILRDEVYKSSIENKEQLIDIIENTPIWVKKNGVIVSSRKKQLMDLNGGRTYLEMRELFFAEMRNVTIYLRTKPEVVVEEVVAKPIVVAEKEVVEEVVEVEKIVEVQEVVKETVVEPVTEPIAEPIIEQPIAVVDTIVVEPEQPKEKKIHFALKTNLLSDLVVIPNIGIEIPFGESRWALDGNWAYTWIINKDHTFCWRIYGGDLGLRRYFGKRSKKYLYEGHHLSLYGQWLTYDIALNDNKGYQSLSSYGGGLVYGFSHSISKKRRLKLDYSIGAGYLTGDYEQYIPILGKAYWTEHHHLNHIGLTKLEISLKWVIGRTSNQKHIPHE